MAASKKYELVKNDTVTSWDGRKLFRVRALIAIGISVAAGDLGGYIESESNLSQVSGNAWVYGDAQVSGNAWVYGNAWVSGNAWVYGNAQFGWFSNVGSENGTLTWFIEKDGGIRVNRGCFNGTLSEFRTAVDQTHGDSATAKQYRLLIEFIELRAAQASSSVETEVQ